MSNRNWRNDETAARPSFNPYEPTEFPNEESPLLPPPADAEAIRKKHLNHEASVRSIGTLYMLGAVLVVLMGAALVARGVLLPPTNEDANVIFVFSVAYMATGAVQFVIGRGLRDFAKSARIGGILLSCIGLLAIPFGTLISGYFIYILAGRKGKYIFSDEYQSIRSATTQISYRTSLIAWVLAAALIFLLIYFIFFGFLMLLFR